MSEVKWIKLSTDIFNNRKIRQIEAMPDGDAMVVIWLKILTLAGNINDSGFVYFTKDIPYSDQLLATEFNRPLTTVQMALKTFEMFGMIEIIDDLIKVSNWDKYQNIEGMEKIREQNRLRKQRQREREKALLTEGHVTSRDSHDIDIDIDKDIDIENKSKSKNKRFTPPTVEQVRAYCKERHNNVDPERFVNYYEANGWMIGKNKMKDWMACVRTWERRNDTYKADKGQILEHDYSNVGGNRVLEKYKEMLKHE